LAPKPILTCPIESSKKKVGGSESEKSITQLQNDSDREGSEESPLILEDPVTENFSPPSTTTTEFFQKLMGSGSAKRKLSSNLLVLIINSFVTISIADPQKAVLERIIQQNKEIWGAILKLNRKVDNLFQLHKKMIREDDLGDKFWEVIIRKFL
jgi:hypothetical protein